MHSQTEITNLVYWYTGIQVSDIQFHLLHIAIHCENNQCIRIMLNFKDIILVINTIEQITKNRFKDVQLNQIHKQTCLCIAKYSKNNV